MTTILKLGGSVITEKDQEQTVDEPALASVVDAIEETSTEGLVLVHGGGSFGHPVANRHGVSVSDGTRDPIAIQSIHEAMQTLNDRVVSALGRAGIPAVGIQPFSMTIQRDDGVTLAPLSIEAMLEEGFIPVLHGDVMLSAGEGVVILSGDDLVVALASELSASRAGLCTEVGGVLDDTGEIVPAIEDIDALEAELGDAGATDVSGGMARKVRLLDTLDIPASIFGLSGLSAFLAGGTPGTTIYP